MKLFPAVRYIFLCVAFESLRQLYKKDAASIRARNVFSEEILVKHSLLEMSLNSGEIEKQPKKALFEKETMSFQISLFG